jgi:hypothetical protein
MSCEKCENGAVKYEETDTNAAGEVMGHTYGTNLCDCRKDLPRVRGAAKWWTTEDLTVESIETTLNGEVTVRVNSELPVSEDNRPLIRDAENLYYGSFVYLNSQMMQPEDALAIGEALVRAAKLAESKDQEAAALGADGGES